MGVLLDTIMVCGVGTILIIRTQLWLTNYPQLGGHGLHIAHLLWGGLGMLAAIVLLVVFLNQAVRRIAAVVGGIGLGFFIDELGKFLTSDNNYFFKPTAAIIYIFFIVFYLVARALQRRRDPTSEEYLANALELATDAAIGRMSEAERRRALGFLARADQSDPAVPLLRELLQKVDVQPEARPRRGRRLAMKAREKYREIVDTRWFARVVTLVFVLVAVTTILEIVGLVFSVTPSLRTQHVIQIAGPITSKAGHYGFVEWANLVSSLVSGGFVIWGLVRLRSSRLAAYTMFERALLVDLFFSQVFVFIQSQFSACVGFLIDLLLLVTVRFMIDQERERAGLPAEEEETPFAAPLPA